MNTSRINRISCVEQADGSIDVVVPTGIAAEFKQLVLRATNTWQDMSPEMRDFADRALGREKSMGRNMKWELPVEDTAESDVKLRTIKNSNVAILRGCNWDCFWSTGCSDTRRCKFEGKCSADTKDKCFKCHECGTVPCSCTFTHY